MSPRTKTVLRAVLSLALLAALSRLIDVGALVERVRGIHASWVGAALALAVVQVITSAWRWRWTVQRLGLDLPLGAAVREYYLATFLNQVLPGGVLGDISRAWRHARHGSAARAIHGVIIERASGQAAMLAVAFASVVLLVPRTGPRIALLLGGLGAFALLAAARRRILNRAAEEPAQPAQPDLAQPASAQPDSAQPASAEAADPAFIDSLARALLAGAALRVQLLASVAVVSTYLATGVVAGRALSLPVPSFTLAALTAVLLLSMLLPVTIAGWGLRESAAAALWSMVGLAPADGVALSVTYGLFVLLGSLPGALALLVRRSPPGRPTGSGAP